MRTHICMCEQVSQRCDYVFVDGTEASGRSVMLNFNYSFLTAQLEMRVWFPRLPLHLHLSDSELSPIKNWRVPVSAASRRSEVMLSLLGGFTTTNRGDGAATDG